ncbi:MULTISPECIES: AAA family ATPase [Streptomyces]|uniref:AAA family ATPase n=1 Tax=Streptomyces TaxID=1883 RepID=UPI0020BE79AE|nr:AAA family ATPase [Streptomyces sp. 43Y-GA-1]MCL6286739.1 AAA family ATPase [Streptomyces sp. 43Y-GA-1]
MNDDTPMNLNDIPDEPDKATTFGHLLNYSVSDLFDSYDHKFTLDIHEPTILTGANGTGKSTILRTIDWISRGEWDALSRVPFGRINLEFERARLEVKRKPSNTLGITLNRPHLLPENWTYSPHVQIGLFADDEEFMRLSENGRQFLLENMVSQEFSELKPAQRTRLLRIASQNRKKTTPAWINRIPNAFPALFVSDQRLAPERRKRPSKRGTGDVVDVVEAIEAAVLRINDEVQRFKSLYGTASQNLDRDFPRRVFSTMSTQQTFGGQKNIARDFEEVQKLRASLAATGLIDSAEVDESISDLPLDNPDSLALISTYLGDTKKKLATFAPLHRRLQPFIEFLRRHYKGKEINIDEERGFRITSEIMGEEISPTHLSSGEQQIFILAHKLLFESSPGTLVIIDEPELSLHVLWQSTFIDDLTEISKVSGTYFLLATHSPTLIAGRSDLRRSLDG